MKLELCEKRKAVIAQGGHLLVLGGPGSGKTTIALLKAQRQSATLKPGQGILFLSFSRAAIRQVLLRCKEILTPAERRAVTVQTYHAFCMEILEAHGRLLHGRPIRFLYPGRNVFRNRRSMGIGWSSDDVWHRSKGSTASISSQRARQTYWRDARRCASSLPIGFR